MTDAPLLPLPPRDEVALIPLPTLATEAGRLPLPTPPSARETPPSQPRPSLEVANTARKRAERVRANTLLALRRREVTVAQVLEAARDPKNAALQRLRLDAVLTAAGQSRSQAHTTLTRLRIRAATPAVSAPKMTIAWLLDGRTDGARILALQDALTGRSSRPWVGYPWAAMPNLDEPAIQASPTGHLEIRGQELTK